MNLFNDEVLDSPEEKKRKRDLELKKIEDDKQILKEAKEKVKRVADSISDSAFWLSYCAMQKAIRQGAAEPAKALAKVAWLKNPWLTYRRLYTILLEDVGGANRPLLMEIAGFYTNGRSYKNLSDVLWFVERMALSPKNREADTMIWLRGLKKDYKDYTFPDEPIMGIVEKINESFRWYQTEHEYDGYAELITFLKMVAEKKLSSEGHNVYVPYLTQEKEKIEKSGHLETIDNCVGASYGKFYMDVVPYTALDLHGHHGKMTMTIFHKKLREIYREFLKKFNILDQMDRIDDYVFAFEGSGCKNEMILTPSRDMVNRTLFNVKKMDANGGTFEEFRTIMKDELFPRLETLREWVFEKKLKEVVEEIIKVSTEVTIENLV